MSLLLFLLVCALAAALYFLYARLLERDATIQKLQRQNTAMGSRYRSLAEIEAAHQHLTRQNQAATLRAVESINQVKGYEHLIEILDNDAEFEKNKKAGAFAHFGGNYIALNSKGLNKQGSFTDKKTLVHEMGHSGGLVHTFELGKEQDANGISYDTKTQNDFDYNTTDIDKNFMNYTEVANRTNSSQSADVNYFNNTVGRATKGQIQTIINNFYTGKINLNTRDKKQ